MYSYFVKAKHNHISNGGSNLSTYTLEREGLENLDNCYYSIGNFLYHNISSELRDEFKIQFSKVDNAKEFPVALIVTIKDETSETITNIYEVEMILKRKLNSISNIERFSRLNYNFNSANGLLIP